MKNYCDFRLSLRHEEIKATCDAADSASKDLICASTNDLATIVGNNTVLYTLNILGITP